MDNRERTMNILHYRPVDRLPAVHFGYWGDLLKEWAGQGKIPADLAEDYTDCSEQDRELDRIIGWDYNWGLEEAANTELMPYFQTKELEVLPDGSRRVQSYTGVIQRIKPGVISIPSEDDYILKDRNAFQTLYLPKMWFSPERVNLEYFSISTRRARRTARWGSISAACSGA